MIGGLVAMPDDKSREELALLGQELDQELERLRETLYHEIEVVRMYAQRLKEKTERR